MPAAPVGVAVAAETLDCSLRLPGAQRSPVDSPSNSCRRATIAGSADATAGTGPTPLP